MSLSALRLFYIWNRLRQMLCHAASRQKTVANSAQPKRPSRRKAKRVFFEMP
jgi:hypothetical protein